MENRKPVGVFDSGLGGISVLKELTKVMPNEDFIYLGDSFNAPYGTKSIKQVIQLSEKNVEFLIGYGAKAIVIACNTATSVAAEYLRDKYKNIPIIGIEPAVKPAVSYKKNSNIVVMATPVTLSEEKFLNLAESFKGEANIIPLPCPGLAELVEEGKTEGEEISSYLKNLFENLPDKKIDSIVLGCTHYPFVKDEIKKAFSYNVKIFDGGEGTARETKRRLLEAGLLNAKEDKGKVIFKNSKNTDEEIELSLKMYEG